MCSVAEEEPKVVLEQTLLNVEEVFIYGIPPMKSSGGHRAEDWNLAKPLATCSLEVLRRDSTLELRILSSRPKPNAPKGATETYPFALCQITIAPPDKKDKNKQHLQQMNHWVENVVDSSRYFVLRIIDTKTGREAHVGMGFRERNDATNFKMSLNEYENVLRREWKAKKIHSKYEDEDQLSQTSEDVNSSTCETNDQSDRASSPLPISKLTLKEGQKIHITLNKNKGSTSPAKTQKQKTTNIATKGGLLLKKPPPPGNVSPASSPPGREAKVIVPPHHMINMPNITNDENGDGGGVKVGMAMVLDGKSVQSDDSSTGAVATTAGEQDHHDDDEEWGDFEGC